MPDRPPTSLRGPSLFERMRALLKRPEPDLPEGLFETGGRIKYTCKACGQDVELEIDPAEFDQDMAYCGGSPWCLP